MTPFTINFKRHHIDWCHDEIGRLHDLIMNHAHEETTTAKDLRDWFARMDILYKSANKAREELDAIGVSHN